MEYSCITRDTDALIGESCCDYSPPSWDVYFLRLSYEVATKSRDPSTKFGAVVVKDKRPILFGYNGLPSNVKDLPERLARPAKYKWTIHSEANALICGAKFGISTNKATLYIAGMPCAGCATMIVAAGISKVVIHRPTALIFSLVSPYGEDDVITTTMFDEAGIEVVFVEEPVNKIAYLGGKKYNV